MANRFLIIGAGFSGCVLAHQLTSELDCSVEIWDERNHLGGNCYTERDEETGIMVHQYGPHIFNTDKKYIWDFVNSFEEFRPYVHRVKARSGNSIFSMPVNLHTINQFFNKNFSPNEAKVFLETKADKTITNPQNFEEQALSFIGRELYEAFFYGYTKKQWGCEPRELPASFLKRIPVRFNYDDNYHTNIFTGIPINGYTAVMEKMIAHPSIKLILNQKFNSATDTKAFTHVFYTGPIDAFYNNKFGKLNYRTVTFEKSYSEGDYQGSSQLNYCDQQVPYTRITEHKHFTPWEKHEKTIFFTEFSKETGEFDLPYYPKRLVADKKLLMKYRALALEQQAVTFLGRLATYRYMDMHHVIEEAIDTAKKFILSFNEKTKFTIFPNVEEF